MTSTDKSNWLTCEDALLIIQCDQSDPDQSTRSILTETIGKPGHSVLMDSVRVVRGNSRKKTRIPTSTDYEWYITLVALSRLGDWKTENQRRVAGIFEESIVCRHHHVPPTDMEQELRNRIVNVATLEQFKQMIVELAHHHLS